jgi:hypothetical protein
VPKRLILVVALLGLGACATDYDYGTDAFLMASPEIGKSSSFLDGQVAVGKVTGKMPASITRAIRLSLKRNRYFAENSANAKYNVDVEFVDFSDAKSNDSSIQIDCTLHYSLVAVGESDLLLKKDVHGTSTQDRQISPYEIQSTAAKVGLTILFGPTVSGRPTQGEVDWRRTFEKCVSQTMEVFMFDLTAYQPS